MGTLNPSIKLPIDTIPPRGGDGDGPRPNDAPGYYERLRRYRMAVGLCLVSVGMIFVSLSSDYVVRQGLGTFRDATNSYKLGWRPVPLPYTLLFLTTAILLASGLALDDAR